MATGPINAVGPLHRVLEGTLIDAVLTNRLDGSTAAPVSCLVTNPIYSHSGQHVLIPAGARVLVSGSKIFDTPDRAAPIARFRQTTID
jgi:type IV secretion system protein VirB10